MPPLDPWIIEEIKKREREKQERERREQPTVPADDPREVPDRPDERAPDPGYEMPSPGDPKRDERPSEKDRSDRGVTIIDIGGNDEEDDGTIDISKIPASSENDEEDADRPS